MRCALLRLLSQPPHKSGNKENNANDYEFVNHEIKIDGIHKQILAQRREAQ